MTHPVPSERPAHSVRTSREVLEVIGLDAQIDEYLARGQRERRGGLQGSRESGADPRHLYKYRPLDARSTDSVNKLRKILVKNQVWMAAPSSLNDPNDMRFDVEFNNDPEGRREWLLRNQHLIAHLPPQELRAATDRILYGKFDEEMLAQFRKDVLDSMGVFSGSRDPRNQLMWAHYGGEDRGICIQFSTSHDELFLIAKPVIYGSEFPKLLLPARTLELPQEHYLIKSAVWAYEKEWRVVAPSHSYAIALRPETVSGVIIGSRADSAVIDVVRALLEERRVAGHPPVKVYHAERSGFDIRLQSDFLSRE